MGGIGPGLRVLLVTQLRKISGERACSAHGQPAPGLSCWWESEPAGKEQLFQLPVSVDIFRCRGQFNGKVNRCHLAAPGEAIPGPSSVRLARLHVPVIVSPSAERSMEKTRVRSQPGPGSEFLSGREGGRLLIAKA